MLVAVDWLDALGVTISGEAVGLIIVSEKRYKVNGIPMAISCSVGFVFKINFLLIKCFNISRYRVFFFTGTPLKS